MARMKGSMFLLCVSVLLACAQANVIPDISITPINLREDLAINAFAFKIEATDADGDPLTYRILGVNAIYFNCDLNSGNVTIRTSLDRENEDVFPIEVAVSDGVNTDEVKEIIIILDDANDNRPIFQNAPYNTVIREDTAVGTVLFKVTATDDDLGSSAIVSYNIDEVVPSGSIPFQIEIRTGEVKLVSKLNYNSLSTFYQLKINASDGGGILNGNHVVQSSMAFAFITVEDVPDLDPQFLSLPYTAGVQEHSPEGTSVISVRAIDRDTGINDDISYSIESSNAADLFDISETDGTITVKGDIDREALLDINYQVVLVVKATEANPNIQGFRANTSAEVSISISDINDNKPRFYSCEVDTCTETSTFTVDLPEHSSGAVPLTITVKDPDQGTNGRFKLSLDGADKEAFAVTPTNGISEGQIQIVIRNSLAVDYEKTASMVLQVIATDSGNTTDCCSTATVTIQIQDINDNNPSFMQDTYNLNLPEHTPNGNTVANITAEDPDTMDVDNILYRLLPDSILKRFNVEPKTGRIFVVNSDLIDREVNSLYSATLQARDQANNTGTTVLEITLTDINDQPPIINRDFYNEFVKEGPGKDGELEISIFATDADDADLPNSQIQFDIVNSEYSDNFTIDPITGVLKNNGLLDRESIDPDLNGKIELNVTATDQGVPALSTWVRVLINVEDINDNSPMFNETSYEFTVDEGMKGVFVGSVLAEDHDQTRENNRISFSILDGSFGSFIIKTEAQADGVYKGSIFVDPDVQLDYESIHKSYSLRVRAEDLGLRTATVMVEVIVDDVNDERPVFKPSVPLSVKENTTYDEALGRFNAMDPDTNHSLVYQLVSTQCRCLGVLGPCKEDWFTLEPSGEIMLSEDFVIDYESCQEVLIEAQVVDVYTEQGDNSSITTGNMVVNILDINDNAPEFIESDSVSVIVSESANKGTTVAEVTATDRDSGINKQMTFEVTDVKFLDLNNQITPMSNLFGARTTQEGDIFVGIIQSLLALDIELRGKYLVTVSATDSGKLSTDTVLEIFTIDISFKIELRFSTSLAYVNENINPIKIALTAATKAAVQVFTIREEITSSRAAGDTIMEVYFVYPNGTALSSTTVENMLSVPEHAAILSQYGLKHIGTGVQDAKKFDPFLFGLLGLVAGLIIVLVVLTTSLVCTRMSYQTKLKAAKAMKSAAALSANENQKTGPVVPGTNKYTMEGANPVLNLNLDSTTDLGFDEEATSSDRVSLNSLDMSYCEQDPMPMTIIKEEDEDNYVRDDIEPLGAALAERGKRRDTDSPLLTFTNPAFSTTDL
ncbi:cadherin-related family member 2 [Osmerus mordax]|uniref:cadherin-related family member 2 n=1 Tax=Osmerus mordax TaxID=8014 RepID=UPI00350EA6A6